MLRPLIPAAAAALLAATALASDPTSTIPSLAEGMGSDAASFTRDYLVDAEGFDKLLDPEDFFRAVSPATGYGRVIVTYREPAASRAEVDWADKDSRAAWFGDLSREKDAILAGLTPGTFRVEARFDAFAAMALDADALAMADLLADPRVLAVEPERFVSRQDQQGLSVMNALPIRNTYRGAGMTIAILDDGVDYNHPMLGGGGFPNSKVVSGVDTAGAGDTNPRNPSGAHGTACAGIAAGTSPGSAIGDYTGGVAPDAKIAAVKVFPDGESQLASNVDVVEGMNWCITNQFASAQNPIRVISMSLGGGRYGSASSCDSANPSYLSAANAAANAGIIVVAASGNNGYCDSMSAPACVSSIVSVGAVYDANVGQPGWCISSGSCLPGLQSNISCELGGYAGAFFETSTFAGKVCAFSNTASFLDVLAPSYAVYSTDVAGSGGYETGDYTFNFGGTSAATPYVAGAAAVLQSASLARRGRLSTVAEVKSLLTSTGTGTTDTKAGGIAGITKPLVNLSAAVNAIPEGVETTPLTSGVPITTTVGAGEWRHFTISVPSGTGSLRAQLEGTGDADLYVRRGAIPTTSAWDFRPYLDDSNELVVVDANSNPQLQPGNTYYVSVNGYTSATFRITVTIGENGEPNDTPAQAIPLAVNGPAVTYNLSPSSDVDYYSFTLDSTQNVKIETSGPAGGDTELYLFAGSRVVVRDDDGGDGKYSKISYKGVPAGTYRVGVISFRRQSVVANYTVRVYTY
ncbi:MAG: S8 family serine peptidase [Candidatus Sumerlaeia bacterium]|nr:S8 family serine peptidase [Candidatus Sumerlaeia bacterium]